MINEGTLETTYMPKDNEQLKKQIREAMRENPGIRISEIAERFGIGYRLAAEIWSEQSIRLSVHPILHPELHVHTCMTAFGGMDHVADYFEAGHSRAVDVMAITDLGSTQSYRAAERLSQQYGIKPIYGAEFYVDGEEEGQAHRVVVLAKNNPGIRRIYDLVTLSQTEYQRENIPFLPLKELLDKRADIVIGLVACDKGIASLVDHRKEEDIRKLFSSFDYVEVTTPEVCSVLLDDDSIEYCRDFIRSLVTIADSIDVPLIASGDVCYVYKDSSLGAGAIDHSRRIDPLRKKSIEEPRIEGRYFRSGNELLQSLSFLGEDTAYRLVIEEPVHVAKKIGWPHPFDGEETDLLPLFEDADKKLAEICHERFGALFPKGDAEPIYDWLVDELATINLNRSASVFLTLHKLVEKAKSDGRIVAYRGLAGNSLVAYLLGLTDTDPMKPYYQCPGCGKWGGYVHRLHPGAKSRFDAPGALCPDCGAPMVARGERLPECMLYGDDGKKVPDIDLVFSADYLPEITRHFRELFGADRVARCGVLTTLPRRSSLLRVKDYLETHGLDPDKETVETLMGAVMTPKRTMGLHPCGYFVLPPGHEWAEFTPLEYPLAQSSKGRRITHYPWEEISQQGFLYKFDLLGLGEIDLLERLCKETGIDVKDIPVDDPASLAVLCGENPEVGADDIPGFDVPIASRIVALTEPKTFAELLKVQGILHAAGVWLHYERKFEAGEITLSDELATNRDDLFLTLYDHGMHSDEAYAIAERVRKGKGLTEEMKATMAEAGVSEPLIEACGAVAYLPPKAHMVHWLYRALRLAYFKLHYPELYRRIHDELFAR